MSTYNFFKYIFLTGQFTRVRNEQNRANPDPKRKRTRQDRRPSEGLTIKRKKKEVTSREMTNQHKQTPPPYEDSDEYSDASYDYREDD